VRWHDDGVKRRTSERLFSRITSPTKFSYSYRAEFVQFQQKYENFKPQCAVSGVFQVAQRQQSVSSSRKTGFPHNTRYAVEAYKLATEKHFSYFLLNLRNEQDGLLRLRSNVFPNEKHAVYIPKWARRYESIIRCWNESCAWGMPLGRATLNNVTEPRTDGLFERVRTNVLKGNVPLKKTTVYSLAAQEERPHSTCKYSYVAQEEKSYCTTRRLSGVVTGACSCSAG